MTDNILDNTDAPKSLSLQDFVGEGKKYATADDLAKAYFNADTHIKTLEQKSDQLRQDYLREREENQTRAKLEDLIQRLEGAPLTDQQPPVQVEKQPIDIDSILSQKVPEYISAYEQQRREQRNQEQVVNELRDRYGDNFQSSVKQQINEWGLSERDFNDLVKRSPQTVLKLFEPVKQESFQAPMRNSSNFYAKPQPDKTWSYYQNLKKTNPRLYHDPKITNEMTEQAQRLGDKFYDGDYNRFKDLG